VHWFHRPPYLRWAAAALLVAVTLFVELRPEATVLHPFAATDLAVGTAPAEATIEWRRAPAGLLAPVDLTAGTVRHPVAAGDPLTPSAMGTGPGVPADWWSVPLPVPDGIAVGAAVLVVITDPVETVPGIVTAAGVDDPFAYEPEALVAVPGDAATRVALAAAARTAMVLVAP
jgi:hypothetical protein